ncbi:hypothetical protein SODALDRAFT_332340 [Sodiomyces alkalinus F11]|uniref:Translation initiation factor 3 N-terminal domain-containing protein n=1 Tax=Sodiomyces alkalinus (strain CBS 110278 / VKM F-3762 / F11) TaxID=1314773 RepID=A0A3N2PWJ0_SODAK|nr:hypothetical protein SODALDRAFT_332340 [Sodiomyces alkalinus F11]ROT38899.1 hypothetical protein SODALDRAFT_332340 [Sodiomyces alkalinus F11]
MKPSQCLFNSHVALYRVFVAPFQSFETTTRLGLPRRGFVLASSPSFRNHIVSPSAPWGPLSAAATVGMGTPFRPFSPSSRSIHTTVPRPAPPRGSAQPDRLPIDLEIRDRRIMLMDDRNNVTGPFATAQILRRMDHKTEMLKMITAAAKPAEKKPGSGSSNPPGNTGEEGKDNRKPAGPPIAVCKIVDRAEERRRDAQREKERKAKARQAAKSKQKEVEVGWAIAAHDLDIKLGRARGFLEKGHKVDLVVARKKGARAAERAEMEELVKNVREMVAAIPGVKERKASEGELGKTMRFYFEGQVPKE